MTRSSLPFLNRWRAGLAALASFILATLPAMAQILITNVTAVNVTPSGFSVVASVSPAITPSNTVSVNIFSGPAGGSLAGQVGVEYYPLNSGDPTATNSYQALLSQSGLRQDSMGLGLIYARVSYCAPNTTYYYQITVTNTNGQSAVWPPSGPLPSATTAQQNSFVLQSQQLLVTLNDSDPPGSIITLSASNSASVIAAVVGDGAGTNQAFFNLCDLISMVGGTNYSPVGTQVLTASVLGSSSPGLTQTYDLIFSNNFSVGQPGAVSLGTLASTISLGAGAMLVGSSGSVPISLDSQSALVGLSFVLNIPTNLFTAISVQPTTPALSAATVTALTSNSVQLTFTAATGLNLQGSQQIAQLNLTAAPNQSSAFVPLWPQSPQGTNIKAVINSFSIEPGRAVIIGPQPLLDMQLVGGGRNLVLYGIPGESYQIQSVNNFSRSNDWSDFARVPMTNLTEVIPNLSVNPIATYFRAYQFTTAQPIIDAGILPSGQESLVLYGAPGQAYEFDYTLALGGSWNVLDLVPLTNSFAFIKGLSETNRSVYYRYYKLNADPPILQASASGTNRSLLAFGLTGTNYALQMSTNLSGTVAWRPMLSYTLTNSFQFFTNVGGGSPAFYRLKKQ